MTWDLFLCSSIFLETLSMKILWGQGCKWVPFEKTYVCFCQSQRNTASIPSLVSFLAKSGLRSSGPPFPTGELPLTPPPTPTSFLFFHWQVRQFISEPRVEGNTAIVPFKRGSITAEVPALQRFQYCGGSNAMEVPVLRRFQYCWGSSTAEFPVLRSLFRTRNRIRGMML